MHNKHMLFLAGLQNTLQEFIKADIGKVAKADLVENQKVLASIEEAHGGAKRLAAAEVVAAKMTYAAEVAATALHDEANRHILLAKEALKAEKTRNLQDRARLDRWNDRMIALSEESEAVARALGGREDALVKGAAAVKGREGNVKLREDAASVREVDVKRLEDYYAAARP